MRMMSLVLALALPAAMPALAHAASPNASDRIFLESEAFVAGHPDLRDRLAGLRNHQAGDYAEAMRLFRRAARHADKPSQGMIAEMYWHGRGVPADRVRGYIWMDLAAERGFPLMIQQRERYWEQLTEDERTRAVTEGLAVYDEYGDDVAKPRLAAALRRERRIVTGSRIGRLSSVIIYIPVPQGMRSIDPTKYFDEKYWEPGQYQAWADQDWIHPRKPDVGVGDVLSDPGHTRR